MKDIEQRRLLGAFIRSRREAADAGDGGRRRTPGLRREELALRAGISATWCAWIEQGREVRASPHALSRLAHALGLTRAERVYMFELAGRHDPDTLAPLRSAPAPASLTASVQALSHPAYGLDRLWNVCCWNPAAAALLGGWLEQGDRPNLLQFIFCHPGARTLIPDWEVRALRILAEFRADYGRNLDDPDLRDLIERLSTCSSLFAAGWKRQAVRGREGGVRVFHPGGQALSFQQYTLVPSDAPDHKLVILAPCV